MNTLKFLLPFSYFFRSRLQDVRSIVFHFYYEWLLAFMFLLHFSGYNIWVSVEQFLLAYIAFISVYEIGYLGNDVYSERFETDPRVRLKDFTPNVRQLSMWIGARLIIFFSITHYLATHYSSVFSYSSWWTFYLVIVVFFTLHNVIRQRELKILTFINLAFTRFLAPIFIFLTPDQLLLIIPSILVCYVLYRTITYMDSKKLLNMPYRIIPAFKVNYYLLTGGISVLLTIVHNSYLPLLINVYYLVFWLAFYIKEKAGK